MRGTSVENRHSARSSAGRLATAFRASWVRACVGLGMVIALAGAAVAFVHQAHAATLNVCATTCTYHSINDALAAANPGDVISVGPGTYGPNEVGATTPDTSITISKAVTLQGAGPSQSIINDAPANNHAATVGVVKVVNPGGNVTISGFTLEGAIVNDPVDDGILITVNDTTSTDTVTITGNKFYGDVTLDPNLLQDQTDSIDVYGSTATVNITHNVFTGVFRGALVEGNPGPVTFSGNDLNALHGQLDPTTTPTSYFWPEGILFLVDGNTNVTSPQVASNNTFENFGGLGVGVDAGYGGGLVGAMSHLTISSNIFNIDGVTGLVNNVSRPAADIYLRGFGTTNGTLTSTISDTTIQNNWFNENSSTGAGFAIRFRGNIAGGINVTHNVLRGGGSSAPPAGVEFDSVSSTTAVTLSGNIVTGFANGLTADTLPTGASVTAHQNCIFNNSTSGATNGSGAAIAADQNWWGAASGPHNATTNASGTGNAASDNITFTPFATTPAAVCAGPVASALATNPGALNSLTAFTFSASLSDTTTGQFPIASAQYNVDGGAYHAMSAGDGSFDQITEAVKVNLGALSAGTHTLCARGTDAAGSLGASACFRVSVVLSVPGEDVMGNASGGSASGAAAGSSSSASTAGSSNSDADQQPIPARAPVVPHAPAPHANAPASSFAQPPLMIGVLLALLGVAGIGFMLFRLRRKTA